MENNAETSTVKNREQNMKEKIFIAGGHPDDLIGAAGFALLNKNRYDFYVLDFTRGERGLKSEGISYEETAKIRTAEESAACALIHATPVFLGEINGEAFANQNVCERIADLCRTLRPRAILTHWPLDVHEDHVMCTGAIMKGIQMSKHECELYFYEETCQTQCFTPFYYVDITSVMEDKIRLIRSYRCQNKNDCLVKNKLLDAAFRGNQIHVKYAEAFAAFLPGNGNKTCIFQKE